MLGINLGIFPKNVSLVEEQWGKNLVSKSYSIQQRLKQSTSINYSDSLVKPLNLNFLQFLPRLLDFPGFCQSETGQTRVVGMEHETVQHSFGLCSQPKSIVFDQKTAMTQVPWLAGMVQYAVWALWCLETSVSVDQGSREKGMEE